MIRIRSIPSIWTNFLLCLCLMAMVAAITYLSGEPTNLVLMKTLVSGLYLPATMGLGYVGLGFTKSAAESRSEAFVHRFVESLALSAWFTLIMWKPDLPVEESLTTSGLFFAIYFSFMLLAGRPW